ncbi:MAG: nucleotidyl transferase AbiEii/AbiGii toxin family protein [Bacteroidota bacterium]|nr:nucleotidyl transferase AbiEii/AbiGii toxin family protein [Bacteroidota bacterium]
MIIQKELQNIAADLKIQPAVLDKDWVLGHFLNAMFEIESVRNNFVFKGGTCLRKCYFEEYRYSEDLDFTLTNANFIINEIVSEKLRSLMQRNRSRDIYDLYFLSNIIDDTEYPVIYKLLLQKSSAKDIDCSSPECFVNPIKKKKNKRAWDSSLGYQLPLGQLIDFEKAYTQVSEFVKLIIKQKTL